LRFVDKVKALRTKIKSISEVFSVREPRGGLLVNKIVTQFLKNFVNLAALLKQPSKDTYFRW